MPNRLLIAACLLALARPAQAQRINSILSPSHSTAQANRSRSSTPDTSVHDGEMVLAGALGVVGGTYAGLFAGGLLERELAGTCVDAFGCLDGAYLGLLTIEPAAVAAGIHWTNRNRGTYGAEFGANLAILIVGSLLAARLERTPGCSDCGDYMLVVGVPIAQIAASIAIEKSTAN